MRGQRKEVAEEEEGDKEEDVFGNKTGRRITDGGKRKMRKWKKLVKKKKKKKEKKKEAGERRWPFKSTAPLKMFVKVPTFSRVVFVPPPVCKCAGDGTRPAIPIPAAAAAVDDDDDDDLFFFQATDCLSLPQRGRPFVQPFVQPSSRWINVAVFHLPEVHVCF